jgi:hypothetical protein
MIVLLYKVAEISSHGEYSYYGSVFISLLRYYLIVTIVKLQYNDQ